VVRPITLKPKHSSQQSEECYRLIVTYDGDTYIFDYTHKTRARVLQAAGRFACNPDLNFDWNAATAVVEAMQQILKIELTSMANENCKLHRESCVVSASNNSIERSQSSWLSAIQEVCDKLGRRWFSRLVSLISNWKYARLFVR